ncbi:MAG TPA: CHC2 zinc finger domain-containing protein [Polyangiaceae bacterium]
MARIPEEEVEKIKAEIELCRVVEAAGIELRPHGKDLVGRCPFHDDKTPSLVLTPERNLWHCLGACQTGGSVIDWVMKAEAVSFRHAVELLRERHFSSLVAEPRRGRPASDGRVYPKKSVSKKLPEFAEPSAGDALLLRRVVDYYHEQLGQSPEALEYLRSRGLESAELIEHFKLGFSNRTLGYRLPAKQVKSGEELRGRLQDLGILRSSGHEHLNGSIIFPIFNERGEVVELYGRKISAGLRKGTPLHLYLPGPHRGVWNLDAVRVSREVILCESLIDAATFWCAGLRNVTCSYGVGGFTDDHFEAFLGHGVERVLIAYDRDEAGDRAAVKLSERLNAAGIETLRVMFPKGMDANEYALKVGPPEKSLRLVVQNAEWMGGGRRGSGKPTSVGTADNVDQKAAKKENEPAASTMSAPDSGVETESAPESELPAAEAGETEDDASLPEPEAGEEETFPHLAAPGTDGAATESGAHLSERKVSSLPAEQAKPLAECVSAEAGGDQAPAGVSAQREGDEILLMQGDRRWRIRGLLKNTSAAVLRINALVSRGEAFFVDTLELYSARQRAAYIKQASEELSVEERVIKRDLGHLLLKLEELQEQAKSKGSEPESTAPKLSEAEQREALELLRDPKLLDRIVGDLEACGIVGERVNKLTSYLAAVSRKLERPLAIVIQSSSAAGKSSLMDAVLRLVPEEERIAYSAMTAQSLFYMGEHDLKHKVLAIAEEEGAKEASYALKLLQSEGRVRIASTTKDPQTGQFVTRDHELEGPVMIFLTTTAIEVDEELLNRCIVLTVDEGREQTRAIHERQRQARTLEGLILKEEQERLVRLHQNAQRLLRTLPVVNPFAAQLSFPDHQTRMRRDHTKYLGLIEAVTLLHQYQRPIKEATHRGKLIRYVEVTATDIAMANRLAREVLGRSVDELPPQTRRLLEQVDRMVTDEAQRFGMDRNDYRFTRRMVRERTRWGDTQLKVHLGRLVELELVVVHRGHHGQRYEYELTYAGDEGPILKGLSEASELGVGDEPVGGSRGLVGAEGRPVLMNQDEELHGPVGAEREDTAPGESKRERRIRTRVNGAPSLPVATALDHH